MNFIQLGGIGPATYNINLRYEDCTNLVAPNRIDAYRYEDTFTQSTAANATTIHVNYGSRFWAGQAIVIWDGLNYDFAAVSSVSGNTVTLASALVNGYAIGTTVLLLTHRGIISTIEKDPAFQNIQKVEVSSYFTELSNFIPQTASSDGKECGWFLFELLSQYANSLNLNLSASNFTMTTDTNGAVNGTGTNAGYYASNTNTTLLSIISDILNVANGASSDTNTGQPSDNVYNLWIDLNNYVHFGAINTTTPTITYDLHSWSYVSDGYYGLVEDYTHHAQDTTNLCNVYTLIGGNGSVSTSGSTVSVTVEDQASVNQYGQIEQQITVANITDETTLKNWGTARLNATAYPVDQYKLDLSQTGRSLTCQDVVQITGFSDDNGTIDTSLNEVFVPVSVEIKWDAEKPSFFQTTVTGSQILPDITSAMRQIAAQHYIQTLGVTAGGVNLSDRFVQNGVQGGYSGDVFSISAGTIVANVTVSGTPEATLFTLPTFSRSFPTPGTYTIAYLYRNTDGTQYTNPGYVFFPGLSVPSAYSYTTYQVIPLYTLTVLGSTITNARDLRNMGGISGPNINPGAVGNTQLAPNPNLATPPVLKSGTTPTISYPSANGGSYDASCTFTLTTTNPNWLTDLRIYAVPRTGTGAQQAYATFRIIKGDESPSSNGAYSVTYGGLSSNTAYDLYCTFLDNASNECANADGTPLALLLGTTVAQPISITTANLTAMPTGTTVTLPAGTTATLAYPTVGLATYDAQTSLALNVTYTSTNTTVAVESTTTNWLLNIELVAQPSSSTNNWTVYNTVPASSSSNTYSLVWGGLGAGGTYTLGIRLKDAKGNATPVLTVGTTVPNPIQSAAIGAGAVGMSQTTGIFTGGTLIYGLNTGAVTSTINQTTVVGTAGVATYLNGNAVTTDTVQEVSVTPPKITQNRYTTSSQNSTGTYSGYSWYEDGQGAVTSSTTLLNGAILEYNVGQVVDVSGNSAAIDSLTMPAAVSSTQPSTALLYFKHSAFKSGSGAPTVAFTGASATQVAPIITSPIALSASDSPSITETVTAHYTNDPYTSTFTSFSSTASVSKYQTNTGATVLTQHSQALNNTNNTSDYSGVTFTATNGISQGSTTTNGSSNAPQVYVTCVTTGPEGDRTTVCTPHGGGAGSSTSYSVPVGVAPNSTYPFYYALNVSAPSGSSTYTSNLGIVIKDGGGTTVYSSTWNNGTNNCNITTGAAGTWTIILTPISEDDGTDLSTYSATPTVSWNGTASYYTGSISYSSANGPFVGPNASGPWSFSTVVAPTNNTNQLSLAITGTTYGTDSHGNSYGVEVVVQKADGSATWVIDQVDPASSSTYTYYGGTETCTSYYVWMRAVATAVGSGFTGTLTYYPNIAMTFYWYQNDPATPTYALQGNNGSASNAHTDGSATVAPVGGTSTSDGGTLGISLTLTGVSCAGDSQIVAVWLDPNNNIVNTITTTTAGTWTYASSSAIGSTGGNGYTVQLYAAMKDTANGVGSYAATASSGTVKWYESINHPITTYSNNAGAAYTYLTANNTVAPTSTSYPLALTLTGTTLPSATAGPSVIVVYLLNPAGTSVQLQYSTNGTTWTNSAVDTTGQYGASGKYVATFSGAGPYYFRYYATGAAGGYTYSGSSYSGTGSGGVYTWEVFAIPQSNGTGSNTTYACSWTGNYSYYIPGASGGNTYILASDGVTQRTSTNDNDIDYYKLAGDSVAVQVLNSAAQTVGFSLSFDVRGV